LTREELNRKQRYLHILNQFSVELIGLMSKEALYWHVAREVVGRLGFKDCVVYELLSSKNILIQRAAIGAKNPNGEQIVNLLEIPVGTGITGTVAASGVPLIIADVAEDERYLPDIEIGRSEICVPIVCSGKVIGVIDCEDLQPNTFNFSHLEILTTVASLLSSKLAQCQVHAQLKTSNKKLNQEIRERKKAEDTLKDHRDALEDIVCQRTAALQRSLDELRHETEERRQAEMSLRENQAMLIQSEKMASIGGLIAGIAHEINNPLAYVSSNLHVLVEYLDELKPTLQAQSAVIGDDTDQAHPRETTLRCPDGQPSADELDDLLADTREGVQRVQKIVADLRDYAYQRGDELESACVNTLLDRSLRLASNELKYKAEVIREFDELPNILCFPERLCQVFLNLFINSVHAIESRGTIKIQTSYCDDWVTVRIADTGIGVAEECLSKIFDPFFTTKEMGTGTGLGLHIVHGIIENHGGKIQAESEVGVGTSFTIRLPRIVPTTLKVDLSSY